MKESNVLAVQAALEDLGEHYRNDWSSFDGRSLRMELDELASWLTSDRLFDLEAWRESVGIENEV